MQRVLIVDHNAQVRAELAAIVAELGVEVMVAENGAVALEILEGQRFDLLLLEPDTPVLDGLALLRTLRGRGDTIDVLLVATRSRPGALVEVMKLGVADYVAKPVKREELLDKMRKVLERRRRVVRSSVAGQAALEARPVRDVLLAVRDDAERAQIIALIGGLTYVAASDAATLARRCKLYACQAVVAEPSLPGLDWPGFARATRLDTLLFAVGDDRGEPVDGVLRRPLSDAAPLLDALRADADPVLLSGNVMRMVRGAGGPERWFRRAAGELSLAIGGIAAARTSYAIVDLGEAPRIPDRLGTLVAQAGEWAGEAGMRLAIVGPLEIKEAIAADPAAKALPFFESVALAKEAGKYFQGK